MKVLLCLLSVFWLIACQSSPAPKLVFPDQEYSHIPWTAEEMVKDIAIRHLYRSAAISTHLMRLQGSEFPHYHDRHDLSVTLLSGRSIIHFQDHNVILVPGDVLFIPRGTYHWAENIDLNASEVFVLFSPAFDGKDRRKAD